MKVLLTYLCSLICVNSFSNDLISVKQDTILMGVSFNFTAVDSSKYNAQDQINTGIKEVSRIERLISSWDPNSQTSKINDQAGISPVKVDAELINLITRAKKVSELTQGRYDISVIPLIQLWSFQSEKDIKQAPTEKEIQRVKALVNFENILIDHENSTVFLKEEGMKIGFGSIGKGYAANRAKLVMKEKGALSGVVNAGGDLICWGTKPEGTPWTIGIANPKNKNEVLSWLDITNAAVVTSGDYENFFTLNGINYCHILDPLTGKPVPNLRSVTILTVDAEIADALATAIFVLGKEEGLKLINHLEGIECIIIDENQDMHFSDHLKTDYILLNE